WLKTFYRVRYWSRSRISSLPRTTSTALNSCFAPYYRTTTTLHHGLGPPPLSLAEEASMNRVSLPYVLSASVKKVRHPKSVDFRSRYPAERNDFECVLED